MALRPLLLAAGALSNPAALRTTLPGSIEALCRALQLSSSAARSPVRTGRDRAANLNTLSTACEEEPSWLEESSALPQKAASSGPRAKHVPCQCIFGAGAAGAAHARTYMARARALVTGWKNRVCRAVWTLAKSVSAVVCDDLGERAACPNRSPCSSPVRCATFACLARMRAATSAAATGHLLHTLEK